MPGKIILKPGREHSLQRKHPWVFASAIQRVVGELAAGETTAIYSHDGQFLAWAAYSPVSQIRARVWSFDEAEHIDKEFLLRRLEEAITLRKSLIHLEQTNAYRLVHAESDRLPGLIVDRYGNYLVIQCLTAGIDILKETIIDALISLTGIDNVYERSDVDVRKLEGLPERTGRLHGEEPGEIIEIVENGLLFGVDIQRGHKTGFYLDQRENRLKLIAYADGREVLNCFSYTGAFSVSALMGGAEHVLSVDSSRDALAMVTAQLERNRIPVERSSTLQGDVFTLLRQFRDQGRKFDLIILDPPKFAPTVAQAQKAARGYKDINMLGMKLLRPGGILFTFSCSGGVDARLFQQIVASAALDAGVEESIIDHLWQGGDHPVAMHFPEGAYLKGLVCQVR